MLTRASALESYGLEGTPVVGLTILATLDINTLRLACLWISLFPHVNIVGDVCVV